MTPQTKKQHRRHYTAPAAERFGSLVAFAQKILARYRASGNINLFY